MHGKFFLPRFNGLALVKGYSPILQIMSHFCANIVLASQLLRARVEARSQAMQVTDSPRKAIPHPVKSGCQEHKQLLDQFGIAVRAILELHEQQWLAILEDRKSTRLNSSTRPSRMPS